MIRYLVMDVDGSLTDGKIYMGPYGETMKAFSVKDGYAITSLLKSGSIVPIILTARTSSIVQNRCNELGIKEVYQGKTDKLGALTEIVGESELGNCAYFGDDIIDLKCMLPIKQAGGIIGCPSDAVQEIKAIADYVCSGNAGNGALREFVEWLGNSGPDQAAIEKRVNYAVNYLKNITVSAMDIGKKVIVNEEFFYMVQSYQTKEEAETKLESHRKYVDIQIMVKGEEIMDLIDISRLTIKENYNSAKDVMFWNTPGRMARVTLKTGDCIVLYPENAHRGAVACGGESQKVLKIVGKVKI